MFVGGSNCQKSHEMIMWKKKSNMISKCLNNTSLYKCITYNENSLLMPII
jgi:hypothetical protein